MEVDDADADRAEAEGWGQKTANTDGTKMRHPSKGARPEAEAAAEAYLAERAGYQTRELRSGPAPTPPPPGEEPASEAETVSAEQSAEQSAAPRRRGRPPKK